MEFQTIDVKSSGMVYCKSNFYTTMDHTSNCCFHQGINKLIGDIDSGNWAISYLLSMYNERPKDFILFENPEIYVNQTLLSLNELMQYSCYMDKIYGVFSDKTPVNKKIFRAIRSYQLPYSLDDIRELFRIDKERFERPLSGCGNEIFRAMAAIAYANQKQVFCFPWMSQKRFDSFHGHLTDLLNILEGLGKITILPIGKA